LANTPNDKLAGEYETILNETLVSNIDQIHERKAKVVFARDTRASGPYLVSILKAALNAVDVEYTDYGIMTTPQLHYVVRCINTMNTPYAFGEPTEQGYYSKMAKAFKALMHGRTIRGSVTVDCANGVGGPKLRELIKYLPTAKEGGIDIKVVNDDVVRPEALNFEVSLPLPSARILTDCASAAPTMSKPSNVLLPSLMLNQVTDAARSTAMLIGWSTTTRTRTRNSIFWTETALPLSLPSSLPT
jgi:hypothetical protein